MTPGSEHHFKAFETFKTTDKYKINAELSTFSQVNQLKEARSSHNKVRKNLITQSKEQVKRSAYLGKSNKNSPSQKHRLSLYGPMRESKDRRRTPLMSAE